MWVDRICVCILLVILTTICVCPSQASPVRHARASLSNAADVRDANDEGRKPTTTSSKEDDRQVPFSASGVGAGPGSGSGRGRPLIRCGKAGELLGNYTTPPPGQPAPLEYKLSGQKWQQKEVTWKITKYSNKVSHQIQENSLAAAWDRWMAVMGLRIVRTQENPDIEIRFETGDHGDGYVFDGQGNVLAHAFGPGTSPISGDTHFDETEPWGSDINDKSEDHFLRTVALHEFGHALGVLHSNDPLAVMAATLDHAAQAPELTDDDIAAVQVLYGPPPGAVGGNIVSLVSEIEHLKCRYLYTAIFEGPDGDMFGIIGSRVFTVNGVNLLYPKPLKEVYPGGPIDVDMGVSLQNGSITYLFNLDQTKVWRFSNYVLDEGFPLSLEMDKIPERPIGITTYTEQGRELMQMFGAKKVWVWRLDHNNNQMVWPLRDIERLGLGSFSLITKWTDNNVYFISPERHIMLTEDFRVAAGFSRKGNKGVPEWLRRYCPNSASSPSPLSTAMAAVILALTAIVYL